MAVSNCINCSLLLACKAPWALFLWIDYNSILIPIFWSYMLYCGKKLGCWHVYYGYLLAKVFEISVALYLLYTRNIYNEIINQTNKNK